MTNETNQICDSELVLQITGYNVTAYEQLYDRYSSIIYTLIKKIIPDSRLAQNVLLNVFAVFLKRIEFYDTNNDNVFTWLMQLTRNISLDVLRRTRSDNDIAKYNDDYEVEVILPKLSSVINPITFDEASEKIKTYKNHLTEVQNLVLSLVYFEGLNEEEIAKRLNLPDVTIKQKIQNTMESLMQLYRENENYSVSSNEIIDLIKLDVLGCLSEEEKKYLNKLEQDNPDFLWKELGEYQNLIALLSTSLPIEKPPVELSEKINHIFNSVLQGKEEDYAIVIHPALAKESPAESKVLSEIPKKTEHDLEIKFKEPGPNQLFILKKQDPAYKPHESISPLAKDDKSINILDRNPEANTRNIFIDKNEPTSVKKETQSVLVKEEKIIQGKINQPSVYNPSLIVKINEPTTLKKDTQPVFAKDEKVIQSRIIQPTSDRLNLNVKSVEQTPVKKVVQQVFAKDEKVIQSRIIQPTSDRLNLNVKNVELTPVKKEVQQIAAKDEKVIQSRVIQPTSDRLNLNAKSNESTTLKKETQSVFVKDEKVIQGRIIQSKVANPNLKVKNDNSAITEKSNKSVINKEGETKLALGAVTSGIKVKDSINIDEIISRIEEGEIENVLADKATTYSDEVGMLKKKLRRNYYLSAGLIFILITASAFIYMKFNNAQEKFVDKNANFVKSEVNGPNDLNDLQNSQVPVNNNDVKKEDEIINPTQTQSQQLNTSLPIVESSVLEKNTVTETNYIKLTNDDSGQLKESQIGIEEKTLMAAPLTEVKKVKEDSQVFVAVEEQPELIGGIKGIQSKIVYPEIAAKLGVEGKVFVQAIVDEEGNVASVNTIKGIGSGCDEAAMDAVLKSKFKPGKQRGKPVKVKVTIPIEFKN